MPTIVELISATDSIVFYPTPDLNGWVYNNSTLNRWYKLASAKAKVNKRPNAHGAYGLGQIFTGEANPIISGQYYGTSALDALIQRNRLNSFFSDGQSVTMRVTDELGPTTREVWLLDVDDAFEHDFSHFPFDLVTVAPDPRRYGPLVTDTEGMPSTGSGLVWNLGTSGSGLYFDWGTPGILGQVEFTNTGGSASSPRIEVGGPGAFAAGFRVTEIETGRELIFTQSTNLGDVIVFDSRTQRATLAGGDVTKYLASRDWFTVPAGATRRYQINPLGAVSGAPTINLYASPAYL